MKRTLIVGDVHGCREELEELLEIAGLDRSADALIFVGDLVAKGPDSQGVVQLAREWGARSVKGNHDAHLLKLRRGEATRKHHQQVARTLREADWRYLEAMPLWLEPAPGVLVVHAGLVPGIALEAQAEDCLINIRSFDGSGAWSKRIEGGVPWASRWPGPQRVVFGHDAVRGLQQWPHALGLDTGCVYGKRLTALMLPSGELLSVPARREWCPVEG